MLFQIFARVLVIAHFKIIQIWKHLIKVCHLLHLLLNLLVSEIFKIDSKELVDLIYNRFELFDINQSSMDFLKFVEIFL